MSNSRTQPFEKQAFLNLKTFRKNGVGVPTPVWFVEHQGLLYVYTMDGSGKVKRIRNNHSVQVAPCDARGELLGEWLDAQAHLVTDQEMIRQINRLLDRKYGLQRKLMRLLRGLQNSKAAVIAVEIA